MHKSVAQTQASLALTMVVVVRLMDGAELHLWLTSYTCHKWMAVFGRAETSRQDQQEFFYNLFMQESFTCTSRRRQYHCDV